MRDLRTNTATRITVGPFFSPTDGVTPVTSLTVANCKLTMAVDTGGVPTLVLDTNPTASGGSNDMVHITGDDAGFFDLELTAANTNYLGRAMLAITDAANHCPVFHEFMIRPAMIYDAMALGTDRLDTNLTHVADTAQTAGDLFAALTTIQGYIDTEVAAIKLKTDTIPASPAAVSDIPPATAIADALLARNAAGGSNSAPTVSTLLLASDLKFSISGTTLTVYAHDGTTVLFTRTIARAALDAITSAA